MIALGGGGGESLEVAKGRAKVGELQRSKRESFGHRQRGRPLGSLAYQIDLTGLGPHMHLDRWICGGTAGGGRRPQLGRLLRPIALGGGGEESAGVVENRRGAKPDRHLLQPLERTLCGSGGDLATSVGHLGKHSGVNVARASWIVVVSACLLAALLFAVNGYTGYTLTLIAVALAAAVNLS